uniref:Glyoxalase-like domain-containing protein n=1 Tax=uncultured bacterium esnapd17 TaxID=1366598 RepID=S5UBT2_9BACT|nr:hypothetical protein [uncultured bacterium esnapd17]
MAIAYKVSIDAQDPHSLADFWAEALRFEREDHSALVEQMAHSGAATDEQVTKVHGRYAWRNFAGIRDPDDPYDAFSGVGQGRRILFQGVPEPKTVKNRVHLDLHVGEDQIDTEVERLRQLGASVIGGGQQGPNRWVVMSDPEGNEFCVA